MHSANVASQTADCTDSRFNGSVSVNRGNMAPIVKYVNASLLRLHRYWAGKQHFEVIKVIAQISIVTVHVAENM